LATALAFGCGSLSTAVVIFWPAAFFVAGDKQDAAELAQMKGHGHSRTGFDCEKVLDPISGQRSAGHLVYAEELFPFGTQIAVEATPLR
jgi:hypothetical protein